MDHFNKRGGRVFPLYRHRSQDSPNITPGFLRYLKNHLKVGIEPLDLLAYLAGIVSHSAYTAKFHNELQSLGIRIPITTNSNLWRRAIELGREVLWLHTFGERFCDPSSGRPHSVPRLVEGLRPLVRVGIPDDVAGMPEKVLYEQETRTLIVGGGQIGPVLRSTWEYEVSGMRVVKHWFDYRKKNPAGKKGSALNEIKAERWTAQMTGELLDLLNVLGRCVLLEPRQAELLEEVLAGPLISVADLTAAGVLPVPDHATKLLRDRGTPTLWD